MKTLPLLRTDNKTGRSYGKSIGGIGLRIGEETSISRNAPFADGAAGIDTANGSAAGRALIADVGRLSGIGALITDDGFAGSDCMKPYLYSFDYKSTKSIIDVSGVNIGGNDIVIAAGPCSVESEEQLLTAADGVKRAGASILRGGAFKPRSSPYSFQGLGEGGIKLLAKARELTGMPIVSEIMNESDIGMFDSDVDLLQVGARNSQNFSLLKELGGSRRPVLLKNGIGTTTDEWLMSAEYLLMNGNSNVVLCYRGVRGIDNATRFCMDIGAIAVAKERTHLPVAVDPSHAAGKRKLVPQFALAAVAAGADMLEIEVHPNPEKALSDTEQQLTIEEFADLMDRIKAVAKSIGRGIAKPLGYRLK